MRVLFQTLPNFYGTIAKAYSPNECGEYEVRFFETIRTKSPHMFKMSERVACRAFETDLQAACQTAIAMTHSELN